MIIIVMSDQTVFSARFVLITSHNPARGESGILANLFQRGKPGSTMLMPNDFLTNKIDTPAILTSSEDNKWRQCSLAPDTCGESEREQGDHREPFTCEVWGKGINIQRVHLIYLQQRVMASRLFVYYNLQFSDFMANIKLIITLLTEQNMKRLFERSTPRSLIRANIVHTSELFGN